MSNVWILVTVKNMFSRICFFPLGWQRFWPKFGTKLWKTIRDNLMRFFFNRALASRGVIVVSWRQSTHEGTILKIDNIGNSCFCIEYLILNSSLFDLVRLFADLNWFFPEIRNYILVFKRFFLTLMDSLNKQSRKNQCRAFS